MVPDGDAGPARESGVKAGRSKKGTRRTASASSRKHSDTKHSNRKGRTHTASRPKRRNASAAASKASHRGAVTRSRATNPALATHGAAHARPRPEPVPNPMPTRHVAPARPVLVTPARSMPPTRDQRKPLVTPGRGPLAVPDFTEAGVVLTITYSIREGRRGEFFDLMRELKPLLAAIGGTDCTIYEDRSRPNYFMEVFRFKDEAEFTAFDDKFHKDRKIAAIYALLDDIVEAEKSDFKIFERRL